MTTAIYRINVLSFEIRGRKMMEQTSAREMAFRVIRRVFLFFRRSKIRIDSKAIMEDQVMELFSNPVMKSDPFSRTIYPDRKNPMVKTSAALLKTALKRNRSWLFVYFPGLNMLIEGTANGLIYITSIPDSSV